MDSINADKSTKYRPFYTKSTFYLKIILGTGIAVLIAIIFSVILLRWSNPPATSFMLQQDWENLPAERYNLRNYWVEFEELPKHTAWAVVASEDQLFWQHWGFDIESIQEAWEERQEGVRNRGASSITQQVAKNIYLWPADSFFRKGVEAGITILIELFWPKERIIEVYLNIAEFGPGVFGIGKASEQFFDCHASALEPDMSARLAAVLPSPKRMRVSPPSPYARERSQWILRQMTRLSGIAYVGIDTAKTIEPQPEDSSAIADPLISNKPVHPATVTPDTLSSDSSFDFRIQKDSTALDSLTDTNPSF